MKKYPGSSNKGFWGPNSNFIAWAIGKSHKNQILMVKKTMRFDQKGHIS